MTGKYRNLDCPLDPAPNPADHAAVEWAAVRQLVTRNVPDPGDRATILAALGAPEVAPSAAAGIGGG